jgi:hypothetical protein
MHARHLLIINVIEIIGFHPQYEYWGLLALEVKTHVRKDSQGFGANFNAR